MEFSNFKAWSYARVWAQVEHDKSTWQVALFKLTSHPKRKKERNPRLRPLFKSLDKWHLVKSTRQVNLNGDPPKITPASCPKNPPRGIFGGGSGHIHTEHNQHVGLLLIFFRSTLVVWHSAHRDNRVNKTWEWKGRSTQFTVTDMSHLTYCPQIVVENIPTPQRHCQVEVWSLVVENIAK